MTQATDKDLAKLHNHVAKAMTRALESSNSAEVLLSEHGADLPDEVRDFLEQCTEVNPALLQAITKFLKDNSITCAVEDSDELSDLAQALAQKKKRRTVGNVTHIEDE